MGTVPLPLVFTDVMVDPFVQGFLYRPAEASSRGLVLTHGAGGNCKGALLATLAETFARAGFFVLRCDLPFRQDRPYGPPSPYDGKRDRAGLRNAGDALKKLGCVSVYLGGQSYGGRQASMLCAEQPDAATGLLLMSYPLHPPRKPEQLRTQHFFDLHTPAMFVEGTRDPFGSIEEVEKAMKLIPAKTKLLKVDGAGHDLGFKGKMKRSELPAEILTQFESFL